MMDKGCSEKPLCTTCVTLDIRICPRKQALLQTLKGRSHLKNQFRIFATRIDFKTIKTLVKNRQDFGTFCKLLKILSH